MKISLDGITADYTAEAIISELDDLAIESIQSETEKGK